MNVADWAALGSAAFAAVAAGASWATVLQTRRERIAAATPRMSIDLITPLGTTEVRVQIMNHGAAVRGVEFAVAVDGQMTFSVTPRPTLGPGETLLLRTAINHFSDAEPVSYVSCYDLAGRVLHAWWPDGQHRVYRVKDRPEERVNRAELMARVAPTLNIDQLQLVRFEEIRE
jgi:hypothetical protein